MAMMLSNGYFYPKLHFPSPQSVLNVAQKNPKGSSGNINFGHSAAASSYTSGIRNIV